MVQAHPFRERYYMDEIRLHPNHCDAWEVANSTNEPYQDRLAYEYARTHGKTMTCGSDIHSAHDLKPGFPFAMETDKPLECDKT